MGCGSEVAALSTRSPARRLRITGGHTLIQHLERYAGEIEAGWSRDADRRKIPFQIVRFVTQANPHRGDCFEGGNVMETLVLGATHVLIVAAPQVALVGLALILLPRGAPVRPAVA